MSIMPAKKIITVVGARPQFIKAAAVSRAINAFNEHHRQTRLTELLVHTGQHYDENMSKVFFDELHIPRPAVNLQVGSGPHGQQTALMLERLEAVLMQERPQWVLIYGDTNSTLAGALAAAKLHIDVAHVEAGLRSFNRRMPEEINRVVADHLSALLFTPTETASRNLAREGIARGVHQVGDVMYDSVLFNTRLAERTSTVLPRLGLREKTFYLATVHRPENTDEPANLRGILSALGQLDRPVVWPMHPRTRKILGEQLSQIGGKIRVIEPVSYIDMLMLEKHARIILTDSGGVQREAYWFRVPCITIRGETEWVELLEAGCNQLVGPEPAAITTAVAKAEQAGPEVGDEVMGELYGDGHSADKIVDILFCNRSRVENQ